ncbi:MAG: flp pilus-assembly TadE/G-like family protein, partial [Actinobacteria bacterium]|nr:flp pilus-assembly TadE/G-like family protein [Actinomycetota bacterium]
MSWRSDRGAATIWVLGFAGIVLAAAGVTVARGAAVLARHRLERAADLAALAGAQQIGGPGRPCPAASRIAAANSATLVSCAVALDPSGRSGTVAVTLRGSVTVPLAGTRTLTARSRAGRLAMPVTGGSAHGNGAARRWPWSEACGPSQPQRPAVRVVDGAVHRGGPGQRPPGQLRKGVGPQPAWWPGTGASAVVPA